MMQTQRENGRVKMKSRMEIKKRQISQQFIE